MAEGKVIHGEADKNVIISIIRKSQYSFLKFYFSGSQTLRTCRLD
jgi:hypothetical protein